ncbi:MAG: signal peptide peptidase SppA [Anaerovoracaceae bacterium]
MDVQKKSKKPIIIFVSIITGIIVLGIITAGISFDFAVDEDGGNSGSDAVANVSEDFIASLSVQGAISGSSNSIEDSDYDHQFMLDSIDGLMANAHNKGLFLFVNSPGGGVYESDELYLKIMKYKEVTNRPVYAYFGSTAASGGYYISAGADKIIANRNCLTGSIGVTIGTVYDVSGFLEKHGIKHQTITSGKNKAMGSPVDKLTKEQRAIYQSVVDESYDQFTSIVADGRDMPIKTVRKIADGRVYTAKQAKKNGLIDDIATRDEALALMMEDENLLGVEVKQFAPAKKDFISKLLGSAKSFTKSGVNDLDKLLNIGQNEGGLEINYISDILK